MKNGKEEKCYIHLKQNLLLIRMRKVAIFVWELKNTHFTTSYFGICLLGYKKNILDALKYYNNIPNIWADASTEIIECIINFIMIIYIDPINRTMGNILVNQDNLHCNWIARNAEIGTLMHEVYMERAMVEQEE